MSWFRTSMAIGCGATACGGNSGPPTFSAKGIGLSFTDRSRLHPGTPGTAYELNCQWDDHPAVIQRAGQQMLPTIKVK
ncbi:MAG: hypothetical protein WAL22_08105 [Solirubrobacteraceae bacterium]